MGRSSCRRRGSRSTSLSNSGIRTSIFCCHARSTRRPASRDCAWPACSRRRCRRRASVLVVVLHDAVVEGDVLDRDVARTAGDAVVRDDDVLHHDLQVLDRFVVVGTVRAVTGQRRLADLLARPAVLQQRVGGGVEILREGEVLVRGLLHRARARGTARRAGRLDEAVAPGQHLDLAGVLRGCRRCRARRRLELEVHVDCHGSFPPLNGIHAAAGGGSSATSRIDTFSSSSWKCGRRNATAL